jgi:tyrosine-protein kinase Etk/Wzc
MTDRQNPLKTDAVQETSVLEMLQVLVKRKRFIACFCCCAIALAVIYSLCLPNIYSATAKVLPPQKEGSGALSAVLGQMGGLAGLAGGGLGAGAGGTAELYLGILKSRSVGDAVIARLDLAKVYQSKTLEAARKRLDSAVKVQAGKDGIISIIAEDKDPKRSAQMANAFVEELGKTTIRLNLSKAGSERLFLEKRLDLVKKDLKDAEESLKSFAQQNKIVQVDAQAKASIEGIARLKAELVLKEVQLAVVSSNRTEESPEVQAARSGIRRLRGELGSLAGNGGGGEGIPSLGKVPGVGLEYSRKLRELKIQEAIFEQLTKQYELAKLNEAKDSSSFQVLDEAVVPINKSKPKRALIVILAAVTSLFLAIFRVFMQDYLARMPEADRKTLASIKKQALAFK